MTPKTKNKMNKDNIDIVVDEKRENDLLTGKRLPMIDNYIKENNNLKEQNTKLAAQNKCLLEALKGLFSTTESLCILYAEDPLNWRNYNEAKELIQKANETI